jgi:nucleoid-associated protein YgaU
MAWGRRLLVATGMMLLGSVAMAEPAGSPSFVPVSISEGREGGETVVVQPGDHLWRISQHHLDQVLGRHAGTEEVDPYWRSVIDLNLEQIQSGDPDLIYPGEVITLPG